MLWPTPSANEPGWKNRVPVDRNGNTPTHANQRWYDSESGRLMQKGLEQVVRHAMLWPTPQAFDATEIQRTSDEARELQLRRGDPNGTRRASTGNLREDVHLSTSSPLASPAKTSHTLAKERDLMANARDCSSRLLDLQVNFDPDTCSWRTSQLSLLGDSTPYSERWPRSGMTLAGRAFRLVPSVRPTGEIEYG